MFENLNCPDHEYCPFNSTFVRCIKKKCVFYNDESEKCKLLQCADKYLSEKNETD